MNKENLMINDDRTIRKRLVEGTKETHYSKNKKAKQSIKPNRNGEESDEDYVPDNEYNGAIQRIWSDKNEITILKTLAKQSDKSDLNKLFDTLESGLEMKVSKTQLSDKVQRLKKKFKNNAGTSVEMSGSHEAKLYMLSKKVWGDHEQSAAKNCEMMAWDDFIYRYKSIFSGIREKFCSNGRITPAGTKAMTMMQSLSPQELDQMEDEWEQHHLKELVIATNRMVLDKKQSKLLQKALNITKSKK